jgi:hypothetical protein
VIAALVLRREEEGRGLMRRSWWWLVALSAFVGGAFLFGSPEPAEADFSECTISELGKYVQSDAALNLRLVALAAIRRREDSTVDGELVALTASKDLRVAVYSCTALGQRKTAGSKAALFGVLKNTGRSEEVRLAAMTAIATHFKTSLDLPELWKVAKDDAALTARYNLLKSRVYGL